MKKKKYDTRGIKETCLNCGKESCNLAGVGNQARINENNGCWIPRHKLKVIKDNKELMKKIKKEVRR